MSSTTVAPVAMPDLRAMPWGDCVVAPAEVPAADAARYRRRTGGQVPPWVERLAPDPTALGIGLFPLAVPLAHISPRLFLLASLVTSRENSCRFCYGVQRTVLRFLGVADRQIQALEGDLQRGSLSGTEGKALEFARALARVDPRPADAERDALRGAGYSPDAITELATVVAVVSALNRMGTLLALPPDLQMEGAADRWLFPFIRPLAARAMFGGRTPSPPLTRRSHPFGAFADQMGHVPAVTMLDHLLEACWTGPRLPRRTRALLFAVVGVASGCDRFEQAVGAVLDQEGLGADQVAEVMRHLDSPVLDAREALLVPFARETVRYQAPTIQARMGAIARQLDRDEVLEVVGTLALANAVHRLSVLLR